MTKYIVVPTQIPAFRFIEVSENNVEGYEFPEAYVDALRDAISELERNVKEIKADITHMRIQQIVNSDDSSALGNMDSDVIDNFISDDNNF